MPFFLLFGSKSSKFQLILRLLTLLNEISAAVNNLGLNQTSLILLTGSLNKLDEGINKLHSQVTGVTIDELFLVHCHHLGEIRHEIEGFLVGNSIQEDLLPQVVL